MDSLDDLQTQLGNLDFMVLRDLVTHPDERKSAIEDFEDRVSSAAWINQTILNEAFVKTLRFKYNFHHLFKMKDGFQIFSDYQEMLKGLGVDVERQIVGLLSAPKIDTCTATEEEVVNFYINQLPASLKRRTWTKLESAWMGTLLMKHDLTNLDPTKFDDPTLLKLYKLTNASRYVSHIKGDGIADALAYDLGM